MALTMVFFLPSELAWRAHSRDNYRCKSFKSCSTTSPRAVTPVDGAARARERTRGAAPRTIAVNIVEANDRSRGPVPAATGWP